MITIFHKELSVNTNDIAKKNPLGFFLLDFSLKRNDFSLKRDGREKKWRRGGRKRERKK